MNPHPRSSSFRWRVALAVTLLVAASLSVAAIGMWGVIRIHEDSSIALRGYRQLREVYEVGLYVAQARQSLQADPPDRMAARRNAEMAISRLDIFTTTTSDRDGGWLEESRSVETQLHGDLSQAISDLNGMGPSNGLDRAFAPLATLASQVRTSVEAHQAAAAHERKLSLILIGVFSAAFVLLAMLIGVMHYRSVMNPVDRLAAAVREFAGGKLDRRVNAHGDREFAQLARDLNHMADELQTLYRDLEQKVEQKSRELVRSERLASVGYLAAGVAHEINNPLGIIAAYAQRALQRMRRGALDAGSAENAQQAFGIICDEAFRCKEITDRLLTMVRSGSEGRRAVSIAALAQEVVSMLADLPQFKHAHLSLTCDEDRESLIATVNDAEIKQVLLNLLVNAAEAIDGQDGVVNMTVKPARENGVIEIAVSDNGRGMESQTLNRVFEPFYSDKKSVRPGTGLGLSICHAIIESHGGALVAASDGIGKGSRFTITLPATKEAAVANG